MNEIWGLTETQFVTAYGSALAGAIIWARTVRERFAATANDSAEPALTTDELAYLAGGPRRAVETSVARLLDEGALRVAPGGRLEATGRAARYHLDMAVLGEVGGAGTTLPTLVAGLGRSGVVRPAADRLTLLGLLVDQAVQRNRLRHAVFPLLALGAVGLLYWLDAVRQDAPIGWVTVALALTSVAAAITTRPDAARRTLLGERTIAAAHRRATGLAADHDALGVSWSAAKSVAVNGFAGYPDPVVRATVLNESTGTGASRESRPDRSARGESADRYRHASVEHS